MLVRRKGSAKQKRGIYEALEFDHYTTIQELTKFLDRLGKIETQKYSGGYIQITGISLEGNRKVGQGQIMLKDEQKNKILTFDPTIFYDWFEQINYGSGS